MYSKNVYDFDSEQFHRIMMQEKFEWVLYTIGGTVAVPPPLATPISYVV